MGLPGVPFFTRRGERMGTDGNGVTCNLPSSTYVELFFTVFTIQFRFERVAECGISLLDDLD